MKVEEDINKRCADVLNGIMERFLCILAIGVLHELFGGLDIGRDRFLQLLDSLLNLLFRLRVFRFVSFYFGLRDHYISRKETLGEGGGERGRRGDME